MKLYSLPTGRLRHSFGDGAQAGVTLWHLSGVKATTIKLKRYSDLPFKSGESFYITFDWQN